MSVVDPTGPEMRPFSVVLVQWLAYMQGALTILGGILLLAFRNNVRVREDFTSTEVTIAAIWIIAIGLITLWVATSYARGSRTAMIVVGAVALLNLGSSLWWLFIHPAHVIAGLVNIALSAIIFYLAVLAPDTRDYFDRYGH
jgi:hypothetical protein